MLSRPEQGAVAVNGCAENSIDPGRGSVPLTMSAGATAKMPTRIAPSHPFVDLRDLNFTAIQTHSAGRGYDKFRASHFGSGAHCI